MSSNYAVFLRHGDYHHQAATPGACQPYPLNKAGEEQAVASIQKLLAFTERHHLTIAPSVHSSLLLRAWQTADIICQQLHHRDIERHYAVMESAQLNERSVGSLANLTISQIEQIVADDPRYPATPAGWKSDSYYQLPYPGAESLMDAGMRMAEYINKRMAQLSAQTGCLHIFIGHGAAFRHAAYQQQMITFADIAKLSMFHAEPLFFTLNPTLQWHHVAGDWKIRSSHSSYTD
ncbi:MAG: histidine phosphatase family protein [Mariprofundus sp.]|nr:histidine phosphatase family protein [Mariprofundus sp.]